MFLPLFYSSVSSSVVSIFTLRRFFTASVRRYSICPFMDRKSSSAQREISSHKVGESLSCGRERAELDISGNRAESGHEDLAGRHRSESFSHAKRKILSAAQLFAFFRNIHGTAPLFSGLLFTAEHDAGNMPAGEGVAAADNGRYTVIEGDLPELVLLTAFFESF